MEIQITVKGTSLKDLQANLVNAANAFAGAKTETQTPKVTPATKKKASPPVEEPETEEIEDLSGADESNEDDLNFMEEMADEETEEQPKAKAAAPKKKTKLTEKDVNAALMTYAKTHGRPAALKVLTTKFKVKSVLELKPEQYAEVIKAVKV